MLVVVVVIVFKDSEVRGQARTGDKDLDAMFTSPHPYKTDKHKITWTPILTFSSPSFSQLSVWKDSVVVDL